MMNLNNFHVVNEAKCPLLRTGLRKRQPGALRASQSWNWFFVKQWPAGPKKFLRQCHSPTPTLYLGAMYLFLLFQNCFNLVFFLNQSYKSTEFRESDRFEKLTMDSSS